MDETIFIAPLVSLSSVTSNLAGPWSTLADPFLYQPASDRMYAWRFGNGMTRKVTLDGDGRIARLTTPEKHEVA